MYRDEEPRDVARDARKFASIAASSPAEPYGNPTAREARDDLLLEDVLDVEGALRLALAGPVDFDTPATAEIERGVARLAGRIDDEDFARLRMHAIALRTAVGLRDTTQTRTIRASIVEELTALRKGLS
jgi:hypothetical protein